ncbi:MAG: cyclic nucleotide-binding domain-containing protein [Pseudomonadota bacterium]
MTVHCQAETLSLLLSLRLFRGMVETEMQTLLQHTELVECKPGDFIIREGEQGNHLFVLIAGKVDIHKFVSGVQKAIQRLGPGECFGEMSLIECRSRSASVRAVAPCKLLRIDGDKVDGLPEVAARLYRNIAIMLSQRLRSANELLALGPS